MPLPAVGLARLEDCCYGPRDPVSPGLTRAYRLTRQTSPANNLTDAIHNLGKGGAVSDQEREESTEEEEMSPDSGAAESDAGTDPNGEPLSGYDAD